MKSFYIKANVNKFLINLKYSNDKNIFMKHIDELDVENMSIRIIIFVIKKYIKLFDWDEDKFIYFLSILNYDLLGYKIHKEIKLEITIINKSVVNDKFNFTFFIALPRKTL